MWPNAQFPAQTRNFGLAFVSIINLLGLHIFQTD